MNKDMSKGKIFLQPAHRDSNRPGFRYLNFSTTIKKNIPKPRYKFGQRIKIKTNTQGYTRFPSYGVPGFPNNIFICGEDHVWQIRAIFYHPIKKTFLYRATLSGVESDVYFNFQAFKDWVSFPEYYQIALRWMIELAENQIQPLLTLFKK